MIYKFSAQNFYSIGDKLTVDLTSTASKVRADELYCKSPVDSKYVSKIEFVGGANASGKTNVLRIIAFLKFLIANSVGRADNDAIYLLQFLPFVHKRKTTKLSVSFIIDDALYDYSVELDMRRILHENLKMKRVVTKRATTSLIFDREWRNDHYYVELSTSLNNIRMMKNLEQLMEDNRGASFISLMANFDDAQGELRKVADYWSNIVTNINILGINEANYSMSKMSDVALRLLYDNEELYKKAREILRKYDIGFDGIIKDSRKNEQDKDIYMIRHLYRTGGFDMSMNLESSGTQRLVILVKDILTALSEKNGVAILDELDAFLHPMMVEELIGLFMSKNTNPNNTQLIFSSQQYAILSELDKQQIILTEKNDEGETEVWRLDDVEGVNNSDNFYTKYLNKVYGGVPRIKL